MKPNLRTEAPSYNLNNCRLVMSPQSQGKLTFNDSEDNEDRGNNCIVTKEDGNNNHSMKEPRQKTAIKRYESPIKSPSKSRKKKGLKRKLEDDSTIADSKGKQSAGSEESMELNSSNEVDAKESSNGSFNCPKCKEVFEKQHSLTSHIKKHNIDDTTCGICAKKLSSASSLDRHMLTHTGEKPFKCKYCPQCFTTNGNMNRHMHIHETKKDIKKFVEGSHKDTSCSMEVDDLSRSAPSPLEESCQGLDLTFENKSRGFQDLSYIAFSSPKFPLVAKKACEENARKPSNPQTYQCLSCQKVFPCKFALEQHEVFHENACGTTCNACECHFSTPGLLTEHVLKYHPVQNLEDLASDNKPNIAFMAALGLHKNVHSVSAAKDIESQDQLSVAEKEPAALNLIQKKNDACLGKKAEDCIPILKKELTSRKVTGVTKGDLDLDKADSFESRKENESHVQTQADEHQSNVEFNEQGNSNDFADITSILLNLAAARGTSTSGDESRYKSKLIETHSVSNLDAKRKKLTHSNSKQPEPCPQCGYTCSDKSSMQRHMITHEDERPFKCTLCSNTFTTKSNGERHAKTKHGLPKHELSRVIDYNLKAANPNEENACKYCGAIFKSSRSLQHHLRSVNNSCRAKPYVCGRCGQGCSTKNNCIRHIQHKHSDDLTAGVKIDDFIIVNKGKREPMEEDKEPGSGSEVDVAGSEVDVTGSEVDVAGSQYESNFDGYSSRTSSPAVTFDNTENQCLFNEDDRVNAAESLVCLSEGRELQPAPIDLSIRPLDLSDKKNVYSKPLTSEACALGLNTSFSSDSNCNNNQVIKSNPLEPVNYPDCSTPLNLTCTKKLLANDITPVAFQLNINKDIPCFNGSPLSVPDTNVNPVPILSPKTSDTALQPKYKAKCEYCGTTFNHKSNKERHIRNFHPEHSRPRKVKNSFPTSQSDVKRAKLGGSTLSNATREALLSRVLQHNDSNKQQSEANDIFMSNLVIKEDIDSPQAASDLENVDLASVSSVINTANSPKFTNYLTEDSKYNYSILNTTEKQRTEYEEPNGIACHECNKSFRWMSALERHIVTHTGVKKYKCPQCGKGFTTNSNMVRHFTKAACCQNPVPDTKHSIDSASLSSEPTIAGYSPATQPNYPEPNHSPTLPESPQAAVPTIEQSMDTNQQTIECSICNTTYTTENDLRNHTKELHYNNTTQGKDISFQDIVSHWKKNGFAKFKR